MPNDAAWAVYFLTGRKPKQLIQIPALVRTATESAGIPEWLYNECYDAVGDVAETIALLLPASSTQSDLPLHNWVEDRLLPLRKLPEDQQKVRMLSYWQELSEAQRYLFNKLLTGAFRVGISQQLVVRAIAKYADLEPGIIAHRLMGTWSPTAEFFISLIAKDTASDDHSRPYPFMLAYPLQDVPESLGSPNDWQIEWKWDGIRSQIIRRKGEIFIWSRGEELVTDRYPELTSAASALPDGTVLDGEILCWRNGIVQPFALLQQRIGRKTLSAKLLHEIPVIVMAYDLLELDYQDLRAMPLSERRQKLAQLLQSANFVNETIAHTIEVEPEQLHLQLDNLPTIRPHEAVTIESDRSLIRLSPTLEATSWDYLSSERGKASQKNVEGLMLKRLSSSYRVGRQRGDWWKWKIDPYTIDAVLIYAQPGSGRRANLYTDYTFGVWDGNKLVPVAKAYSGLSDEEIKEVDQFVRKNTTEKFGPVRILKPELVFELAFAGIQKSNRHKSGIAVRFPRIARWRRDKLATQADSLQLISSLIS